MRQQTVFAVKLCSVLIVNNLYIEMAVSAPDLFAYTVLEANSRQCNNLFINSNSDISTNFAANKVNNSRAVENSQIIGDIPRIRKPELQIPNDFQVVNQVPLSSDRREITVTSASTGTEQVFLTSLPDAEKFELFGVEFKNISGIDLRPLLVESGINTDENVGSKLQQFKVSFANNTVSEISLADGSSAVFAGGEIVLRSPNGQEIERIPLANTSISDVETIAQLFAKANKSNLLAQNSSSCKANAQSSLENVANDITEKKAALQGITVKNSQNIAVYNVALGFTSSMLSNRPASANLQETICKPPVQCNEQVVAGRSEIRTDLFQVPKNTSNKSVSLEYEFFNIPDKLEMLYDGKKIFEVGPISGSDRKVFALPNTAKLVGVRVIGNRDKQTEWNYKISCTGDAIAQNHNELPPTKQYEVRLKLFIPSPAISVTGRASNDIDCSTLYRGLCIFGGDGRAFGYSKKRYRLIENVVVKITPNEEPQVVQEKIKFCPTEKYLRSQAFPISGKPYWWWAIKPGEEPKEVKEAAVKQNDNYIRAIRINSDTVKIFFKVRGSNPLVPGAPPFNAQISAFIQDKGQDSLIRVEGKHDNFPAYEMYVNSQEIYKFDPLMQKGDPTRGLTGLQVQSVSGNWQAIRKKYAQAKVPECN